VQGVRSLRSQHPLSRIGKTLRSMSNSRSNKSRPMATRTERRRAAIDRRRQFARRSVTAQVAARRRRSRIRWSAAAAGVAVLGAGAIVLIASRDDGGIPNVTLTGKEIDAEGALGITAPLSAYTIDYDLTSYGADPENPQTATEKLRVSRPFGSDITFTQADETSTYTSVLGKASVTDASGTTVSVRPAGAGTYDWRLDATLEDLVASGKLTLQERREVAGRECQVYRTGSPLESGSVTDATETDYAEMCIDASGLLLEEVVYASGLPSQHVIATAVSEDPVEDIAVDGEPTDTTTSFTDIASDAAPVDGYWSLSTVPEGYELVGRYAYTVPGQLPDDTTTDTTVPVDTTAAPTATTAAPTDSSVADSTATDSTATDSTAADTTVAGSSTDSTSAAQGFAGSNVLTALTSTTTTVPADDSTTSTAAASTTAAVAETTTLPAESTTTTTAAPAAPPVTSYVDVYRNGDDFLIVHQGPSAEAPTASGATSEATIEPLGTVTKSSGYDGSMILARPAAPADWFVSISGSVDMATLTTIAGGLAQPAS
jgi:hypothetical protein